MAERPGRLPLLYDEDCGFCVWALARILAWDCDRRLRPVPLQSAEAERMLGGMDRERRMASFHLVTVDGTILSGGDAAPLLLRVLPGGFVLSGLTASLPEATRGAYRFVADHRTLWGRAISAGAKARGRERIARRTRSWHPTTPAVQSAQRALSRRGRRPPPRR